MLRRVCVGLLVSGALLFAGASPARATDGHFLHGVGAVNNAMGGAGVAAPVSILGTFYLNPAGLIAFDGLRVEFSFEMFKPDRTVASEIPGFGSGSTVSKSEFTPIPAMGFSYKINDKWAVGLGGLGIGGFGVDYPQDNTNPVLGPRPLGFGQVFSSYSLLKFTPAVAFAPSENISLGFSANVAWATLTVDPAPFASPAISDPGPPPDAFYSRATGTDGSFGFGFQAGLLWKVMDNFSLGASYSSPLKFEEFKWNSLWENPNLPTFGTFRELQFGLDMPGWGSVGLGWNPVPALTVAADFRYYWYESTDGFKLDNPEQPFDQFGAVQGFGWENIWALATGLQYELNDTWVIRGGYNYAQNPIPDGLSFINIPAPAIVQHHATLGLSVWVTESIALDFSYYKAFENSGTGPLFGAPSGSTATNTLSESAFSMGFTFDTK
ncbi:MAG: outer membrane protein transport protein [Gemmatimonadetes bacterium]|nr:outer membrane protein transport protein [Gemmatimonadota bacterium]